jgi:hypothetical protein
MHVFDDPVNTFHAIECQPCAAPEKCRFECHDPAIIRHLTGRAATVKKRNAFRRGG